MVLINSGFNGNTVCRISILSDVPSIQGSWLASVTQAVLMEEGLPGDYK